MNEEFFRIASDRGKLAGCRYVKEPARSLALNPTDWWWATWRMHEPWARPQPRPFNLEAVRAARSDYVINWYQAPQDLMISSEEALFWLADMLEKTPGDTKVHAQLLEAMKSAAVPGKLSLLQLKAVVAKSRFDWERAHALLPMQVLAVLLPVQELVDWLSSGDTVLTAFLQFRTRVLPYLNADERNSLKDILRPKLTTQVWESDKNMSYYIASCLGMHDEIRQLVEHWPDDYKTRWHLRTRVLQYIIFGLGSASAVEKHMRRLQLKLDDPNFIQGWIAHTEYGAVDVIAKSIEDCLHEERLPQLISAFARIKAPEPAPFMFELALEFKRAWRKEAPMHLVAPARQWLTDNRLEAVLGLLPFIKNDKHSDELLSFLRQLQRDCGQQLIEEGLSYYPDAFRVRAEVLEENERKPPELDAATTPDWLSKSIAHYQAVAGKPKVPEWLNIEELPVIPVGTFRLNKNQATAFVCALQQATADSAGDLTREIKAHSDPGALEKCAEYILDAWIKEFAPNKERWALFTVGHLGGNKLALRLVPLIKGWRASSNQPHAQAGLDCLRLIGTDTALMQLNAIANDQQLKALRLKALEHMEAIAASLNLSKERLEDRLIPTCGLDRAAQVEFNFGPRKFFLAVSPDMTPALRDEKGALKDQFPKANSSDNQDLYRQANEQWKMLKRELKTTLQIQALRLELSMVSQRRWFLDEFLQLLVAHPIASLLVRRLLWAGYDTAGEMIGLFRVTIDGQFMNAENAAVKIDDFAEIGVVHPLQMTANNLAAWQTLFAQMEIVQPFPQLQRTVHTLTEMEREHVEIHRARGHLIPGYAIPNVLEKRGWIRGAIESGCFDEHTKPFERAGLTAVCIYQSVPINFREDADDQTLEHCYFVEGVVKPEFERAFEGAIALGDVDPIVLSEVMNDLFELVKKAKSHAYE